jgi:hypothetical protein
MAKEVGKQAPAKSTTDEESNKTKYTSSEQAESEELQPRLAVVGTPEAAELFQDSVELEVRGSDTKCVSAWVASLYKIPDLRILPSRDSTDAAKSFLIIIAKPMPLLALLRGMPLVSQAIKKDGRIQVTLESAVPATVSGP